ncbi:MAG: WD40 repeat [Glomeribacter sp. 1016415]|nr:WD40 repeat [Glomeribacter sp. 1016415]
MFPEARPVTQNSYGLINISVYGAHNESTVNFDAGALDPKIVEALMQGIEKSQENQRKALQPILEPLAKLGVDADRFKQAYKSHLERSGEVDVLSMYVPVQGIKKGQQGEETVELEAELERFFASKAAVFLLQGVAGTGKSTFNRHLALKKLEDYQRLSQTQNDPPLVFFIELRSIENPNKQVIEQFLQGQGFASEQIELLRTHLHQCCIFIFDGYDEIKERNRNFYDLNKLWAWEKAKFVITSRPEYLDTNYQAYFRPKKAAPDALWEARMAPFSAQQRSNYIQNYVNKSTPPWTVEQYEQAFNKLTTLSKELERPVVLRMLLQILPELGKMNQNQKALTLGAIYEHYFQKWWSNWQNRLGAIALEDDEKKAKKELCERKGGFIRQGFTYIQKCAIELTKAGLTSAQDSEDFEKRYKGVYAAFFANDAKARLLCFNAPFQIKQKQHYEFSHKSMQEYLVARAICAPDFDAIDANPENVLNQLSLVKEPVILDFLVEQVKGQPQFKAYLRAWIEASKVPDAVVTVGAANAITILVRAGVQFNGADLNRIRIPGADLSYGVFDSAQLQGSDLSGVNFRQVWLYQANLSSTQMAGVQFGEWPTLKEKSEVHSCVYSPDGKACAMGLEDDKVRVYDTSSWAKIRTLRGHTDGINSVAYSRTGTQLASGSSDHTVRLWDVQSGESVRTLLGHTDGVNSVAYSPSGTQLASGSRDNTVRLWDAQSGDSVRTLLGHTSGVTSVAYSPSGTQLASGSWDNTVRLWDAQSGDSVRTLLGHTSDVTSVAYSPSGTQLASGSWDNTVRLWDAQSGESFRTLHGHTGYVYSVAYSPSGTQLASGSRDNTVRLWDAQSGESVRMLCGHTLSVKSVAYSPSGTQLASGSRDKTVRLWDAESGESGPTLRGHTLSVKSVAYSPSGTQLASGSMDDTVRLWDTESGDSVRTLRGHTNFVMSVAYSPSGTQLASGSWDNTVRLWDAQSGESFRTLHGHTGYVYSVAYSPSGTQLASGSMDDTVRLWDAESGESGPTLRGHTDGVNSVAYSPSGTQLASGSNDKTVRLWDAESGDSVRTLLGHTSYVNSVAYSPSGTQLASGSYDTTVRLWDAQSGDSVRTLLGHTYSVISVAYSPSGTQLASGSWDNTVRLWNVSSGQCLRKIEGFSDVVLSVAWQGLSEWKYLLTGGHDNLMRKWEVKKDGAGYKVKLVWMSRPEALVVTDTLIEGVRGLNEVNHKLLKQRGARFSENSVLNFIYKNMSV